MNRTVLLIGALLTAALVALFYFSLGNDPTHINSPLVGRTAPEFALKAVGNGELIDLAKLRGKPVVLNFWATWCVPCYEEHPVLVANARQLGPDVQFVGVVFNDTEDKIMQFLRERGASYPTLIDEQGKTAIAYGVGGVPETFFLDKRGTVVAKYAGPLTSDALREELMKAMK
jgi:cytochrome c biogenesis protein CcmG/thiol:disulfide interchange protein DsbE